MTFNTNCKFLDQSYGRKDIPQRKIIGGKTTYPSGKMENICLSEDNPDNWISECPKDCPYFELKKRINRFK